MARFNLALAYLSSLPETDQMYVKILKSRIDTAVLNRNNFGMMANAAYAAAKYTNPSMKIYRGGQETSAGGHIDKVVTTYLTVRTTLSISAMVRSPFAYLSFEERVLVENEATASGRGLPSAIGISADQEKQTSLPTIRLDLPSPSAQQGTPTRQT
jgi:hypothetical protein